MGGVQISLDKAMLQRRHIQPCRAGRHFTLALSISAIAACEGGVVENRFDELAKRETVFSEGGIGSGFGGILGGDEEAPGQSGIPINAFLWRAALDTVGFLPLSSADPFGGVIISDWYADAAQGAERFKVNVIILSRELVADGVSVRVFRQVRDGGAVGWADAAIDPNTPAKLENAILQRARELRIAASTQG